MTGTASGTIPAAELLQAYRTMRTIRDFEERVYKEFQTGQMPGFVHLYAGEEAVATAWATRHGARLVMSGKVKKEDGLDFEVHIGRNTFQGKARVAWTMPLISGQTVAGLEFLTFHLAA